jgi:hypothetical protein
VSGAAPPPRKGIAKRSTLSNNSNNTEVTDEIITQGQSLLRAIEALDTIIPSGRVESQLAEQLMGVYRHRLRELLKTAPAWIGEEILSAGRGAGGAR